MHPRDMPRKFGQMEGCSILLLSKNINSLHAQFQRLRLLCSVREKFRKTHSRPQPSAGGDCDSLWHGQALLRRRLQQEADKPSGLAGWNPRTHGYTTTIAMGLVAPLAVVVSRNFRVGGLQLIRLAYCCAHQMQWEIRSELSGQASRMGRQATRAAVSHMVCVLVLSSEAVALMCS